MNSLLQSEFQKALANSQDLSLWNVQHSHLSVFVRAAKSDPATSSPVVKLVMRAIAISRINLVSGLYILCVLADVSDDVRMHILEQVTADTVAYYKHDEDPQVSGNAKVLSAILFDGKRLNDFLPEEKSVSQQTTVDDTRQHKGSSADPGKVGLDVATSTRNNSSKSAIVWLRSNWKWLLASVAIPLLGVLAQIRWGGGSSTKDPSTPPLFTQQNFNGPVQMNSGGNNFQANIVQDPITYFVADSALEEHELQNGQYQATLTLIPVGNKYIPELSVAVGIESDVRIVSVIPDGYTGMITQGKNDKYEIFSFPNVRPVEQKLRILFDKKPGRINIHWQPDKSG